MKITFNGNLKDLLKGDIPLLQFKGKRAVKDLIQSLGIPHTEVGRIVVNQREVDLSFLIQEEDVISVYSLEIPVPAASASLETPRILCDVHLWKLARRLRILGIDTLHNPQWDDAQLAQISRDQKRILLSRDRGLLMRNQVETGLLIRNTDPEAQVKEVLSRLALNAYIRLFSRCPLCNGPLEPVDMGSRFFKENLKACIPAKVLQWHNEFNYCDTCRKPYWKGSHYKKLLDKIQSYLS